MSRICVNGKAIVTTYTNDSLGRHTDVITAKPGAPGYATTHTGYVFDGLNHATGVSVANVLPNGIPQI